ncbi:MAG: uracil-DNA glycosylase [Chloroflexi bacterium]|nr:uracil-DNA glycosylase [Chloroflexota bacterium]
MLEAKTNMADPSGGAGHFSKTQALARLAQQVRQEIPSGKKPVLGEGRSDALLMVVGEAPGKEEEAQGRPFVGPAGKLLNRLLTQVALDRSELWVTNLVKWWPTEEKGLRTQTATPRAIDARLGLRWLIEEIRIIHPRLILCLGNLAARAIIGKDYNMTRDHGAWYPGPLSTEAMATFHPAYPLRAGEAGDSIVRLMLLDLLKLKARFDQVAQQEIQTNAMV